MIDTLYNAKVYPDGLDGAPVDVTDDKTAFDDVLDNAVSSIWEDVPFRMFRMDFDVENGALEATTEVTERALDVLRKRYEDRGFDLPEWMTGEAA